MRRAVVVSAVVLLAVFWLVPRAARSGCCENGAECMTAFFPGQCSGAFYPGLLCLLPNTPGSVCFGQGGTCTFGDACSDGVGSTCDVCAPNIASPAGAFVCTHVAGCDDGNPCTDDFCDSAGGAFGCRHVPNNAPCNDGHACTVGDHCAGGTCVGGPPPNCDDGNPCTDDVCSSAGGSFVCLHPLGNGPCDDGNRCTTNDRCTSGTCAGVPDLNTCHYECYEVKRAAFSGPTVSLVDQFAASSALVQRPERLCAPADKNDEDPPAPANPQHLVGYRVRHTFTPRLHQRVVDQFGEQVLDVGKADRLMVPSAKSLSGPVPPLGVVTTDHFQCYKVRRSRETPRFTPVSGVKVDDQFGTVTVTVKKALRLCAPVDKNGEDPGAESDAVNLLCYQTSRVPFPIQYPFVNNQFGPQSLTLIRRTELCLPAEVNPPVCGNGVVTPPEQCDPPGSLSCPPGSAGGAFVTCSPGCSCPGSPSGAFLDPYVPAL